MLRDVVLPKLQANYTAGALTGQRPAAA